METGGKVVCLGFIVVNEVSTSVGLACRTRDSRQGTDSGELVH